MKNIIKEKILDVNNLGSRMRGGVKYNALEDYVLEKTDDIKALYYSCILYEQEKEYHTEPEKVQNHIDFWEKESDSESAYSILINDAGKIKFCCSNLAISVGCSSVCNAKCSNCTHEKMVRSGELNPKIIDLKEICYWIRKFKLLTVLFKINVTGIDPNSLGEPLTNPYIIDIYKYMKIFFPDAMIGLNTNCSLLKGNLAEQIASLNLRYIYLSLSYFDKKIYEREIGLNYDNTIDNICHFIELRNEMKSDTKLIIHIFNNNLNSEEDRERFKEKFQPLLRSGDVMEIRKYYEEISAERIKTKNIKKKSKVPCYAIWQTLTIDTNGNVYPCCFGLWKKYDEYLSLGHITDSPIDIVEKWVGLRKNQMEGNFGTCLSCSVFDQNIAFNLPKPLYDMAESAHSDISYITGKTKMTKLLCKLDDIIPAIRGKLSKYFK